MKLARPRDQHLLVLGNLGIGNATIDWADRSACLMVEKTHTFGALGGNDVVEILRNRWGFHAVEVPLNAPRINCGVRTFRLACAAVYAVARDNRCHLIHPASRELAEGMFPRWNLHNFK